MGFRWLFLIWWPQDYHDSWWQKWPQNDPITQDDPGVTRFLLTYLARRLIFWRFHFAKLWQDANWFSCPLNTKILLKLPDHLSNYIIFMFLDWSPGIILLWFGFAFNEFDLWCYGMPSLCWYPLLHTNNIIKSVKRWIRGGGSMIFYKRTGTYRMSKDHATKDAASCQCCGSHSW